MLIIKVHTFSSLFMHRKEIIRCRNVLCKLAPTIPNEHQACGLLNESLVQKHAPGLAWLSSHLLQSLLVCSHANTSCEDALNHTPVRGCRDSGGQTVCVSTVEVAEGLWIFFIKQEEAAILKPWRKSIFFDKFQFLNSVMMSHSSCGKERFFSLKTFYQAKLLYMDIAFILQK